MRKKMWQSVLYSYAYTFLCDGMSVDVYINIHSIQPKNCELLHCQRRKRVVWRRVTIYILVQK